MYFKRLSSLQANSGPCELVTENKNITLNKQLESLICVSLCTFTSHNDDFLAGDDRHWPLRLQVND